MSDERVVCERCGTAFAEAAWTHLRVDRWERVGEVLTERRDCLCQTGRMGRDTTRGAVAIAHENMGNNVVLVIQPYGGNDGVTMIVKATTKFWVGAHDVRYRRESGYAVASGYVRTSIRPEELPRLEAWAKTLDGGKAAK